MFDLDQEGEGFGTYDFDQMERGPKSSPGCPLGEVLEGPGTDLPATGVK